MKPEKSATAEGMPKPDAAERQADQRDPIMEARDKLTRIKDLNELIFLAGEGMIGVSRNSANAICAGCDIIADQLEEVCELLDRRAS